MCSSAISRTRPPARNASPISASDPSETAEQFRSAARYPPLNLPTTDKRPRPSAAGGGARGVGAVRDRDVPRPQRDTDPLPGMPLSEPVGREGLLSGLIPAPLRPKSTALPAPARRSVWGFGRRRGHPAPPDL